MHNNILYGRDLSPLKDNMPLRPRIKRLMERAVRRPLVVVTAGAGFGKSYAVSLVLNRAEVRHIWLRLTELDNYTVRFWENFLHSAGGDDFKRLGFPDTPAVMHEFLHTLAGRVDGKFCLVLDGFHVITEPVVLHLVEGIISARMRDFTVIITGRATPQLTLHGLDTAAEVFHINADDLAFTVEESAEFMRLHGVSLPEAELAALQAETGGWGAALCAATYALQNKGNDSSAVTGRLFDLIEHEVFSHFDDEAQKLLVTLSLFERIPADVMREHPNLASQVGFGNFFIKYNPQSATYDLHSLLLSFLKSRRDMSPPEQLAEAHLLLAERYRADGFVIDSIRHYEQCRRFDKIWEIILGYEICVPVQTAELFLNLLEKFDFDDPLIPVVQAHLLFNNGHMAEAKARFLRMVEAYERTGENAAQAGECYLFLGMISLLEFNTEFIDYYRRAAHCLPGGSRLIDDRLSFSQGNYMLLVDDPSEGTVKQHVDAVMEIMPLASRTMNGAADGIEYITKAEAAYYRGELKDAETAAYRALYQAGRSSQLDTAGTAYFVLVRVYFGTGNYAKAAVCLDELRARMDNLDSLSKNDANIYTRDVMLGWYYSRLGDHSRVPGWITSTSEREKKLLPNNLSRDPLIRAYCLLLNKEYLELSAYLDSLEPYSGIGRLLEARIEVQIFKSVTAHKLGDTKASAEALTTAYNLAKGNQLFMPFVEMGKYMRSVIYALQREGFDAIPSDWLDSIYSKAAAYEKQLRSLKAQHHQKHGRSGVTALEPLTLREKEILRRLCQGLTSDETAGQMYISTSAVKKALTGIYNKLGASNRADAVRIATESGLLSGN